ncbi:MAG: glycoside hydrolase family 1 protein [Chloroflexota bacterium]|nr:glycoside hydrolase family 1 protein [Dehalococcoidia bacterium]MDW8254414.1 glycoside hydrolase family 1 protein [Chloroflexota bacterium]
MSVPRRLAFPEGFLWGAATAAHQVEGHNFANNWWDWEQQPGRIRDGTRSHPGVDQWTRFEEDFALLAELGHSAHRLSIEWSRVVPAPGEVDRAALDHYRRVLECLREHQIEPFVTLHHFTNPRWFEQRGSWRVDQVDDFLHFVETVVATYRDLVRWWITVNEPGVYANLGYVEGIHPPGDHSLRSAARVIRHLLTAHRRAYALIHRLQPEAMVGLSHHVAAYTPFSSRPADRLMAWLHDRLLNHAILAGLDDPAPARMAARALLPPRRPAALDFIGINYYTRSEVRFAPARPRSLFAEHLPGRRGPKTLFGWEVYPRGLRDLLLALKPYRLPIVITENGVAEEGDTLRPRFIVDHLRAVHAAIRRGADVRGYLHWTAFDNFEWAEGLRMRFGLVHVDFATGKRTPKPSALLYARICRRNALDPADWRAALSVP